MFNLNAKVNEIDLCIGKNKDFNADLIHENGVYIGNNQFVSNKDMKLLNKILGELK